MEPHIKVMHRTHDKNNISGPTEETSPDCVQLGQVKKEPLESEDTGSKYHKDLNLHKETVKMDNNHVYKWTVASSGIVPLKVEGGTENSAAEPRKITVVYPSIAGIRYPTLQKARSLPIADSGCSATIKIEPSQNSDQYPEHSEREDGGRSDIEDMKQVSPGVANENSYKDGASEHSKRAVETNRTETEAAGRVSTKVQQKVSNKETSGSGKVLVTILNRSKPSNSVVKSKLEIETMVKKALTALKYKNLKEDLKNNWSFIYNCTLLKSNENCIEYLKFYHGEATTIQLSVKIQSDLTPLIHVHGKHVSPEHDFWSGLPDKYTTPADIVKLLFKLNLFTVCMGNIDKEYQSLIKSHVESRQPPQAYLEGDFGAVKDGVVYTSSIRTMACELLTKYKRCRKCRLYRNTLTRAKIRETKDKENPPSDLLSYKKPHSQMNSEELTAKLQQALKQAKTLAVANDRLRQQLIRKDDALEKSGGTIGTSFMTGGELNMGTHVTTEESGHVPQFNDFTIVTEGNDQDKPAHREEGSKDGTTIMVVPKEMSTNKDFQAEIGSQSGGPHEGLVLKAMNGGTKMNSLLRENDADFTNNHVLEKTALKSPQNLANSLASQIGVCHEDEKPIQSNETAEMSDDSHPVAAPKNPHPDLECHLPSLELHGESHQSMGMHDCKECGRVFPRVQDLQKHARTHYERKAFKCSRCRKIFPSLSILVAHRKVHTVRKCDKCGKAFSNAIQLQSHALREHWDDHQFKCNKCDKVFSQYPSLALHRRTHIVKERPFKCCICNRAYTTNNSLTVHMKTHTGERPYKCTQCSKAYSSSESLKKHVRIHTGENSCKCKLCGKTYSSFSSLRAHMRVHSGEKPYKCEYCDKRFHISGSLTNHRKTHTGEKPHKCDICPKAFSRLFTLKIHRLTHTGEKSYKCKLCNMAFNNSGNLTRHQRIHSGERPYQCELCGKSFGRSAHLEAHLMLHNGEKPKRYERSKSMSSKCEICDKEFMHASYYKIHMRNHTGERPYRCQECGKSFNQKGSLTSHMMVHTEAKPFQCNLCEKAFKHKISLKQHAVTHSGEKPHKCEQCGLAFGSKSNLGRHQLTHTGEKPFQCEQCGKAFARSCNLTAHIKTHTSRSNNAGSRKKAD